MQQYNENLSYEILENGYSIYLNGELWITQPEPYAHNFIADGTYEENCLAQLEELTKEPEQEYSEDYQSGYEQALLDLMEVE